MNDRSRPEAAPEDPATNPETKNTPGPYLSDQHRRELVEESGIDPEVVEERGYFTLGRRSPGDDRERNRLKALGIPSWATKEDRYFPGWVAPIYSPSGQRSSAIWKPHTAITYDGKPQKYASPKGQRPRLDVHPRNRDKIIDPAEQLWHTEGIKKADALTSLDLCVVGLPAGVWGWKDSVHGTLGDWEDVILKGRDHIICFDADARSKPNVLRAMARFGRWLQSKGAKRIWYVIVPAEVDGLPTKGVDDYLVAGGTLRGLFDVATTEAPEVVNLDDTFSDSRMAETITENVLTDRFHWVAGLGWQRWDERRWTACTEVTVLEEVRKYMLDRHTDAAQALGQGKASKEDVKGWFSMLSAGRQRSVLSHARGLVEVSVNQLDPDPDLLNTPAGVVDLETGELSAHNPDLMMTKITGAEYRPGFTHADWEKVLEAVPADVRDWLQIRLGQAITGHIPNDDKLVIYHGDGSNGKSTLNEVTARSIGSYFLMCSDRLLMANPDQHPTELMDLAGVRYAVAEETPEAGRLSAQRLKKTIGTPTITARRIRQDDVTFDSTHSLFLSTNHRPMIAETDNGTWRRLAMLTFPYTFEADPADVVGPLDRLADLAFRDRARLDLEVWAAALAWMVEGARRWYAAGRQFPPLPRRVVEDTKVWKTDNDLAESYIEEKLRFDRDHHIAAAELVMDLNAWLVPHGQKPWSDKLIAERLRQNERFREHRVEKVRKRGTDMLSRPAWLVKERHPEPSGQYLRWEGLRFVTELDHLDEEYAEVREHIRAAGFDPDELEKTGDLGPPYQEYRRKPENGDETQG